jgi:ADP-ribosylglycohydrolase
VTGQRADRFVATLLGTAVGDALGLPREGLSRRRAERLFGPGPLTHRFLLGRGMVSDDTEHAAMTAQALLASGGDEGAFTRALGWRLRGWLAALPAAIGWATLRATVRLSVGFSPLRSGVASAGNGPLMRAPILGIALAGEPHRLISFVCASTRVTHVDPRAEQAAIAIALAAAHGSGGRPDIDQLFDSIRPWITDAPFAAKLERVRSCLAAGDTPAAFAQVLGFDEGVSGFAPDSACAALFCWLRYPDCFDDAVEAVILLGGDTDTTGAIVGGLAGATLGTRAIPRRWIEGITDWPLSPAWLERLGNALASQSRARVRLFWPAILLRNALFGLVAIAHVLRRLLPPY